jgi:hypothetical protein
VTVSDRLELDEDGRVIDPSGGTRVLDLADPAASDDLSRTALDRWVESSAAPFLRRHRTAVRVTAAVAAAATAAGLWAATRPPYVAPTVAVDLGNAVLDGNSIGGPEISADGILSVAFTAQALTPGEDVDVLGITGPGLGPAAVGGDVGDAELGRIELAAQVQCDDPSLAAAQPSSYALSATATSSSGDSIDGVVPLASAGDRPVTRLDRAIGDWCLQQTAPTAVELAGITVTPVPGTTLADISLAVRNASPLPLTLRTERREGLAVDVDLSPGLALEPGRTGSLATRINVHDCSAAPALDDLSLLPNPTAATGSGITLGLALGDRARVVSYPLPDAAPVTAQLRAAVCTVDPRLTLQVLDVEATRPGTVTWAATALLGLRSDGKGISLGRERFDGAATDAGTLPVLGGEAEGGWAVPPVRLDGGAGRLAVGYAGGSCLGVAQEEPQPVAARVTMPDGTVVPYEVLIDDARVLRAAHAACGIPFDADAARSRGWDL